MALAARLLGLQCTARGAQGALGDLSVLSSFLRLKRELSAASEEGAPRWVFLGPPGVGKGTYAARVAEHVGIPHIAAGDLVRAEIKAGTAMGKQMKETVDRGSLLPDELVLELVQKRLEAGQRDGERGFLLDGFPRTVGQARALEAALPVTLALNLSLREDVLIEKCLGRRLCSKCGKNWNVADIWRPATGGQAEVRMPPLSPPAQCAQFMTTRSDDTEEVVRHRLRVYQEEAGPVEEFYGARGLLVDFAVTGGIPETLPRLLDTLTVALSSTGQRAVRTSTA